MDSLFLEVLRRCGEPEDGVCHHAGAKLRVKSVAACCAPEFSLSASFPFLHDLKMRVSATLVCKEPDNTIHGPITRHPKHGQDAEQLYFMYEHI